MEVICTCGRLLHGKAGKHGLDVKKGLNVIDNIVEDLRSAWGFYKMCKKDPDAGATGAKADA